MKITIESTTQIVEANGVPCRIWEGESERGVKVQCLIVRIAAHKSQDLAQFESGLAEQSAPSPDFEPFPLRMIL